MIIQNRDDSRRVFVDVWDKYGKGRLLAPLEQLILDIVMQHPEYHGFLKDKEVILKEFEPGTGRENPFLHMGMHIAISEQVATDRPAGITTLYKNLAVKHHDQHKLQHSMMECLGESLWWAQQSRAMPDDMAYLECLRKIG